MSEYSYKVFKPGTAGTRNPHLFASLEKQKERELQALVRKQAKYEVHQALREQGIDPEEIGTDPPKEEPKVPLWLWVVTAPVWLPIFLMFALPHLILSGFFLVMVGVTIWMIPQVLGF